MLKGLTYSAIEASAARLDRNQCPVANTLSVCAEAVSDLDSSVLNDSAGRKRIRFFHLSATHNISEPLLNVSGESDGVGRTGNNDPRNTR